jgi:hypothetical protein
MIYGDCKPWLHLYQKVTREIWYPGVYIQKGLTNYLYMIYPDGKQDVYYPSDDDKQATDWYVPAIDHPGFECCVCGKRIQHEEPIEDVWRETTSGYDMNIRHRECML